MSGPGFSVGELIKAVDWTIKFINELSQVQDQVRELLRELETCRDQLQGLERVLVRAPPSVNHRATSFNTLQAELHKILNDSVNLLKRFHHNGTSNSGIFSNFRQKFRWMVDGRYQGSVKDLQERISKIEWRIGRELDLLNIHYHQDSYEARNASPSSVSGSQKLTNALSPLEKEIQPSQLSAASEPSIAEKQLVLSSSKSFTDQGQPRLYVPVRAPLSPPPSPPLPLNIETRCSKLSLSDPAIDGPVLPSPSARSWTASTGGTNCASNVDNNRCANPVRRASTLPCIPSLFSQEILAITGTLIVHLLIGHLRWFELENPHRLQPYKLKSVAILRDSAGCFRGIEMTRPDGRVLKEEISPYWHSVTKHPLPVHGRHTREACDSDGQARNCVRFLQDRKGPGVPKFYSLSNDGDYQIFQSKIVGKSLLFWAEVKSISSAWSKTTPLCETQVLQLWQSNGIRSIQFFRNGKDGVYSQHSVSSLRISHSSAEGLKLVFVGSGGTQLPGTVFEQEQRMKFLFIIFTSPTDMTSFLEKALFPRM